MFKSLLVLFGLLVNLSSFALQSQSILMVCTGNTGRSPMAEAIANDILNYSRLGYPAFSRGIKVNPQKIKPEANAITVMNALGIHIALHKAQQITIATIAEAHWVLTMTTEQKAKVIALDPIAHAKVLTLSECATGINHDITDAYDQDLMVYRQTRDQIEYYLRIFKANNFNCHVAS